MMDVFVIHRLSGNWHWPRHLHAVVIVLSTLLVPCIASGSDLPSFIERPDLPTAQVRSGSSFLTPATLALQQDTFANPGYLWVERGEGLFRDSEGAASCQTCHGVQSERPLAGVAARYPVFDKSVAGTADGSVGQLVNVEQRINLCRVKHQALGALPYESAALLSLTAYVASLSRGSAISVAIEGKSQAAFEQGRGYFFRRKGQLNLACNQCHDDHWGRRLRGDLISQGHGNAFPAYRFEWQSLGSLHRRIRDCDVGVRAQPHAIGSQVYTALELYLAWRARGLEVETPGVRR